MQSTAFQAHDHSKCVTTALRRAQDTCAARQVRLTPIRQRVLEILLESHRAMGAYDVLGRLSAEGLADKPPVAYRALNFLLEQGLVHRIEKLNAYVACDCPIEDHAPTFLICMAGQLLVASTTQKIYPVILCPLLKILMVNRFKKLLIC